MLRVYIQWPYIRGTRYTGSKRNEPTKKVVSNDVCYDGDRTFSQIFFSGWRGSLSQNHRNANLVFEKWRFCMLGPWDYIHRDEKIYFFLKDVFGVRCSLSEEPPKKKKCTSTTVACVQHQSVACRKKACFAVQREASRLLLPPPLRTIRATHRQLSSVQLKFSAPAHTIPALPRFLPPPPLPSIPPSLPPPPDPNIFPTQPKLNATPNA